MVQFLPQRALQVPTNANIANQLAVLGQQIGGAIQERRNRNALLEIGQAAQGGDLGAAADVAFQRGQPDVGARLLQLAQSQRNVESQIGARNVALQAQQASLENQRLLRERLVGGGGQAQPSGIAAGDQRAALAGQPVRFSGPAVREAQPAQATGSGGGIFNGLSPQDRQTVENLFLAGDEAGAVKLANDIRRNPTFQEKERIKRDEKQAAELRGRAQGARSFLNKIGRIKGLITEAGDDAFGPIQGSEIGQFAGRVFGTDVQRIRERITAQLRDLELDVARFKLKGQGQVTEAERAIAKETLPALTTIDAATALQILDNLENEARETISAGGGQATVAPQSAPAAPIAPPASAPQQAGQGITSSGIRFRVR